MKRTEDSLRDPWDNIKCTNIQVVWIPEEEEKMKACENICEESIVENFSNMKKEIVNQVQEAQDQPKQKAAKTHVKQTKNKHNKKVLKAEREKQLTFKEIPICLIADLSVDTLQARRKWQTIVKVLKGKNIPPRLLYPARILIKTDGEIKSFSDKQKLRDFNTTRPALEEM